MSGTAYRQERVAAITDIHANLPALETVLARIDQLGLETVYCGGDLVGYGPHPNEVCPLIEERGIPTIYGNYDYAIARDRDDCGCAYVTQHDRDLGQRSVEWTLAHTDKASKDFMRELPFDRRFPLGNKRVRLVHGSPRKVNEYLFEDKPARTFERIAAPADCDVLVFGHTHKPWIHTYGGVLFVNCGSVGKPRTATRARRSRCSIGTSEATSRHRSSGCPTTRRPSHVRSRQPACPRSTPRSLWRPPETRR